MKQIIAIVIVLVIMVGFIPQSYADYEPDHINVLIDGKQVKVKEINAVINGQPINSDVPPILYNERTLVPVRFVAEHLNAEIGWDQEKYEASIKTNDCDIVIKINSLEVTINGQAQKMPYNVPAKLVTINNTSRTMVPLRFVSEALGFDVDWEDETWTGIINFKKQEINNVSVINTEEHLPKIVLDTTGIVSHNEIYLEQPYRLVIDIPRTTLNISDEQIENSMLFELEVNKYPIKEIRASQFSKSPDVTRVVVELDRYVGYEVNYDDSNKKLEVSFVNKINEIAFEEIKGRKAIVIKNTNIPEYNILRLSNPDRVVLDLMDSYLLNQKFNYEFETDFISKVRTSQFKPDSLYNNEDKIVRIVFDIKEMNPKPNFNVHVVDNDLVVYIDYNRVENMKYNLNNEVAMIQFNAKTKTSYNTQYDEIKNIYTIKIPKSKINLDDGMTLINDNIVRYILIEESGDYKNISIKLRHEMICRLLSESNDSEISVSFVDKALGRAQKTIVIDAGHGGKDPGAISPYTKVKEKDLNLNVALKLDERLRKLGFNTKLIRDSDRYVGLYERANIANDSDGELFISIHFNAADNTNINGLQTLYCPSYNSDVKQEDQYPFAEAMHKQLLKELGLDDKRIERRPKLVVTRETKMPAVLVELGFLTNREEENRVTQDKFINDAAQSLANGVIKYLEEN